MSEPSALFTYDSLKTVGLIDEARILIQLAAHLPMLRLPENAYPVTVERAYSCPLLPFAFSDRHITPEGATFRYNWLTDGDEEVWLHCQNAKHTGRYKLLTLGLTKASKPSSWYLIPAYQVGANGTITISLVEFLPPTEAVAA